MNSDPEDSDATVLGEEECNGDAVREEGGEEVREEGSPLLLHTCTDVLTGRSHIEEMQSLSE